MFIRYRYPNEDWIEIEGDDYDLELRTEGQCLNTIYRIIFTYAGSVYNGQEIKPMLNPDGTRRYLTREQSIRGTINSITYEEERFIKDFVKDSRGRYVRDENGNVIVIYADGFIVSGARIKYTSWDNLEGNVYCSFAIASRTGAELETITKEVIATTGRQEDDCQSCVFKVFKDEELILEIKRDVCPQVSTEEGECPEGTCKVICGNVACCYGSDGVAVSSFNL